LLAVLVASLASVTFIYAWKLESMLRGMKPWLYFTAAISLSMAAIYCFLLLTASGLAQGGYLILCYPLAGASMVCYRRWLAILSRLIPNTEVTS
jgi:hypothetical protein